MAYSDYGGYAYKNGIRVDERSDVEFSERGLRATPGRWPGWSSDKATTAPETIRAYHVVIGDGPIFICLYKSTNIQLFRGFAEQIDLIDATTNAAREYWNYEDKSGVSFDYDWHCKHKKPVTFELDGNAVEIHYIDKPNYFQFVRMTQPDGNVWTAFSGYGVGAGLEDSEDHGGHHPFCLEKIVALFGPHDHTMAPE